GAAMPQGPRPVRRRRRRRRPLRGDGALAVSPARLRLARRRVEARSRGLSVRFGFIPSAREPGVAAGRGPSWRSEVGCPAATAAPELDRSAKRRGNMRGWSVFGCGVMQLGLRRDRAGGLETTRWGTLCYLPLLPLSRWRGRYAGVSIRLALLEDVALVFEPLGRLTLNAGGVFWTAWCGWCLVAVALAPALGCVIGIQGPANHFQMALVLASCCWPLLVLIAVQWHQRALVQRRKTAPAIHTWEDLAAALKSGAIRPHAYRYEEQQW